MIKFYCKYCGTRNIARNSQANQEMVCTHCGKLMVVPEVSDPAASKAGMESLKSRSAAGRTSVDETSITNQSKSGDTTARRKRRLADTRAGDSKSGSSTRRQSRSASSTGLSKTSSGEKRKPSSSDKSSIRGSGKSAKPLPKKNKADNSNFLLGRKAPVDDVIKLDDGTVGEEASLPLDAGDKFNEMMDNVKALYEAGVISNKEFNEFKDRIRENFGGS